MNRTLKILLKAVGIGVLSGLIICITKSFLIIQAAERLAAAADPWMRATIMCPAETAATLLPIFGIIAGAFFGLVVAGLLLDCLQRRRLP